jgi:hypothetical protein
MYALLKHTKVIQVIKIQGKLSNWIAQFSFNFSSNTQLNVVNIGPLVEQEVQTMKSLNFKIYSSPSKQRNKAFGRNCLLSAMGCS